jgi:MoaA/NifB/PqqE/SkfB family radical SAM enzyme
MCAIERKIKSVDLKLTDVCNINCIMCGQRVRNEGVFVKNYLNLKKIISFFSNIPPRLKIYLWGGEPLLHPQFCDVVSFFLEKKAIIAINTNGFLLDRFMKYFCEVPIETLIISLDGLGEIHDKIRRNPGLFNRVEKSLKNYINLTRRNDERRSVVINFTVLPENYLNMEEFCEVVKSWDVDSINFNFPILVNEKLGIEFKDFVLKSFGKKVTSWEGYIGHYENAFDYAKFAQICNRLINRYGYFIRWSNENMVINENNLRLYYENTDQILPSLRKNPWPIENNPCKMISTGLAIDATGNIVTCPDFPDTVIGNIEDNKFEEFYKVEPYHLYNLDQQYSAMCYRCPHRT